jgi:RNA polymerase sigma factor (sigma-70 family)
MEDSSQELKRIYQEYASRLFTYGMNICPDKSLVEDAIHDLFLDLHNHPWTFAKASDKRKYLFASMRYKVYKLKKERLEDKGLDLTHTSQEETVENKLIFEEQLNYQKLLAREMLLTLTERQREILFLRFFEHLSFQEIADQLSIERQSAQNLFGRAIGKLRRVFLSELVKKEQ